MEKEEEIQLKTMRKMQKMHAKNNNNNNNQHSNDDEEKCERKKKEKYNLHNVMQ